MTEGRLTFVTLATNDAYAIGALILGHSLRQTGTKNELTIIITEGVPHNFRELLRGVFDNVVVVKPLQNLNTRNLSLLRRPELGITYSKLYCWKLIEFTKGVFLDADTIVLQNIDDLFDREELSAAPDASWPDIFNSGVFVFRPSLKTFAELCELAKTKGSFDGGDQHFCKKSSILGSLVIFHPLYSKVGFSLAADGE
uniref:glycogenin glucosyltransferase n=1 Tax=Mesocestoides corti TaxID=53468 RepID=A0A5K3FRR5_MESCO